MALTPFHWSGRIAICWPVRFAASASAPPINWRQSSASGRIRCCGREPAFLMHSSRWSPIEIAARFKQQCPRRFFWEEGTAAGVVSRTCQKHLPEDTCLATHSRAQAVSSSTVFVRTNSLNAPKLRPLCHSRKTHNWPWTIGPDTHFLVSCGLDIVLASRKVELSSALPHRFSSLWATKGDSFWRGTA